MNLEKKTKIMSIALLITIVGGLTAIGIHLVKKQQKEYTDKDTTSTAPKMIASTDLSTKTPGYVG